ncbi:MAG TPA: hypothetical protein EYP80_01170 [Candidatus Aenigmarchaeota archaeon]|nr:hypothetical protein [Candidatus Aenigmarchaeota archaeon]
MYKYLFEECCFSRAFITNKKINFELIKRTKESLAKSIGIRCEDVELSYYSKSEDSSEVKIEAIKEINNNFVFKIILTLTEKENLIVLLNTFISRITSVYLTGFQYIDIISNIMQEFSRRIFYTDLIANLKLKYEELSKKIYEDLEILFDLEIKP